MSLSYYGTLIKLKAQFPNEIDKKIQCSCQKPLFISVNLVIYTFLSLGPPSLLFRFITTSELNLLCVGLGQGGHHQIIINNDFNINIVVAFCLLHPDFFSELY